MPTDAELRARCARAHLAWERLNAGELDGQPCASKEDIAACVRELDEGARLALETLARLDAWLTKRLRVRAKRRFAGPDDGIIDPADSAPSPFPVTRRR